MQFSPLWSKWVLQKETLNLYWPDDICPERQTRSSFSNAPFSKFSCLIQKKSFFHLSGRLKKKVLSWEKHIFSSMCRDEWNKKKLWKRNKVIHVLSRVKNVFCWKWSIRKKRKILLAPQGFCRRQPVVETSLTAWEDTLSWSRCSSVCHFFSVIYTHYTQNSFLSRRRSREYLSPQHSFCRPRDAVSLEHWLTRPTLYWTGPIVNIISRTCVFPATKPEKNVTGAFGDPS